MTRGVAHPPDLRAEAVAAVLAGAALADVARLYGISKGTLGTWLAQDDDVRTVRTNSARARDPEALADLILDLIAEHIITIRAQLREAARPEYVAKQPAAELASLVAVERDTALRLLAGLRPADHQPALEPPARAPESTDG